MGALRVAQTQRASVDTKINESRITFSKYADFFFFRLAKAREIHQRPNGKIKAETVKKLI